MAGRQGGRHAPRRGGRKQASSRWGTSHHGPLTLYGVLLPLPLGFASAFAFAFLRFPQKELLFLILLAALMVPNQVTILPNYLTIAQLGWINTYQGIVVPGAAVAYGTFLLRQYYRGIPIDFDEAARMDGASILRIWGQIIVPLSGPVLATLSIFVFQGAWNDFLWPLVVTTSEQVRTIPLGLASFVGQYSTAWDMLMAGSVIALLPVLLIYLVGQKWFVQGIALSGMGGR